MNGLVWFRNDLRVHDNPALTQACKENDRVYALYFIHPKQWKDHTWSPYRIKLTLNRLKVLEKELKAIGVCLMVLEMPSFKQVPKEIKSLIDRRDIGKIYASKEYAFDEVTRDNQVWEMCEKKHISIRYFHTATIIPPGILKTKQDTPYRVFTPFKRSWLRNLSTYQSQPLPIPKARSKIKPVSNTLVEDHLSHYHSIDTRNFGAKTKDAFDRLDDFSNSRLFDYKRDRDFASCDGTSRLSPYLAIGMLSPQQCLNRILNETEGDIASFEGAETWLSELIWREFYINIMHEYPDICKGKAFKPATENIAWSTNKKHFKLWCQGKTGFPLVDAAMTQLNTTGWMHNRLRMVTATFLSKYLLQDWRLGEAYFMKNLIDGHFASNNGGWQWCASTGADAAPYFRLLSPVRQAERFDPQALFIKQMLPILGNLPAKTILSPGHTDLLAVGYPEPIIDLKTAKDNCLEAFKSASQN